MSRGGGIGCNSNYRRSWCSKWWWEVGFGGGDERPLGSLQGKALKRKDGFILEFEEDKLRVWVSGLNLILTDIEAVK